MALHAWTIPHVVAGSFHEPAADATSLLPDADISSSTSDVLDPGGEEKISDWKDIGLTALYVGKRLTHPTSGELMTYAGLVFSSLYLEQNKWEYAGEFEERRNFESNATAARLRPLGEAVLPVIAASAWALGHVTGSSKSAEAGLMLLESMTFTGVATEIGQFVFAEERPFQGGQMHYFRTGGHGISGHTSVVASIAIPLDRMFFQLKPDDGAWKRGFKVLGKGVVYALPLAVGWSRMNDDLHFAWNVEMGMGVGFVMGDLVAEAHGLGRRGEGARPWNVSPIVSETGAPGLSFTWVH